MDFARLIHDYLDGEISGDNEDILFDGLSSNPELRYELNKQIQLQSLAQQDMNSITPPVDATNAIFSTLGFSIPTNNSNLIDSAISNINHKSWFSNYHIILTAIISMAVTTGLLYLLFNIQYQNRIDEITQYNSRNGIPSVASHSNSYENYSMNNSGYNSQVNNNSESFKYLLNNNFENNRNNLNISNDNNNGFNSNSINNNNIYKNSFFAINKNNDNEIESIANDIVLIEFADNSLFNNANFYTNHNSIGNNTKNNNFYNNYNDRANNDIYLPFINSLEQSQEVYIDKTKYSIGMRGLLANQNSEFDLNANEKIWFKNIGIFAMYKLSPNHAIGIEVGQEEFGQKFILNNKEQIQNPLLLWYGAFYRYSANQWSLFNDMIFPFSQVFLGANVSGPIGRVQIGLQYRPAPNVTFSISGEGTALFYNVQNKIYTSKKMGISYGVTIHY